MESKREKDFKEEWENEGNIRLVNCISLKSIAISLIKLSEREDRG